MFLRVSLNVLSFFELRIFVRLSNVPPKDLRCRLNVSASLWREEQRESMVERGLVVVIREWELLLLTVLILKIKIKNFTTYL